MLAERRTDVSFERQVLDTLLAFRKGDWSVRMPSDLTGVQGKIADLLNEIIGNKERVAKELDRISHVVGREGKLSERARVSGLSGGWATLLESINTLISDLVRP